MRGTLENNALEILRKSSTPLSVRDVLDSLNEQRETPLAYTTILTVLTRLTTKGVAERRRTGRFYSYSATMADEAELAVRSVLQRHGARAVAHFFNQVKADRDLSAGLQR
jgi:BlaI family transcriptional regulator, penicillinase repressor